MDPFVLSLVASLGINALFFAFAAIRKTDVVTDLSYSLSFAIVAGALIATNPGSGIAALLPAALTILWALRLGSYLFGRIMAIKVDHRFDDMRDKPLKFARFWILQAITVFIVSLPVAASAGRARAVSGLGAFEIAGIAMWALGFVIEAVADAQKSSFKRKGAEGFISTGLWAWSRHPNYFGEALLWWGVLVMTIPSLEGALWLVALGPAFITALLLFVSGVPLLEKAADRKHGGKAEYEAYKARTSIFFPLPPRRSA
jgi:steroid 5-alpha reductase family enzyme